MSRSLSFVVSAALAGKRLDSAIAESGHELTRSQVKNLIEQKRVALDGKPASKAGVVVLEGQTIHVEIPDPVKLDLTPQEVGLKILYEDEHLAVLDKPSGISMHPSETETGATVVHGLLHSLSSLSSVGGTERPGIVHRIDKGTSGIVVVSKTDQAHLGLSAQFKAHTIDRRYRALVYGDLAAKMNSRAGRIETWFGRHPVHRKKMTGKIAPEKTHTARKAVTHWSVIETFALKNKLALTLVECRLETGRTHQIRVHLSELGFPLVGDPLYGDHERHARALAKANAELSKLCLALDHQLLHAFHLGFEHPVTKERLEFSSELPEDFRDLFHFFQCKPDADLY